MTLDTLWQKRLQQHHKQLAKYLKYVFNDHFMLVLFILIGLAIYQYSQFLSQFKPNELDNYLVRGILSMLLAGSILVGQLATLVQPADSVFLSVLERDWDTYFEKAKRYSLFLPVAMSSLLFVASYPLWLKLSHTIQLYDFIVLTFALKAFDLTLQVGQLKQSVRLKPLTRVLLVFFLALGAYFIASFQTGVGVVLAVILLLVCHFHKTTGLYNWPYIVAQETTRMNRVYRLLQLFVDVPIQTATIKRRAYLDKWLQPTSNAYTYAFMRAFVRDSQYSALVLRLSLFMILMTYMLQMPYIVIALGLIGNYLTLFQLLPLYHHYDNHVLVAVYPLTPADKYAGFVTVIKKVMLMQIILWGALSLLVTWQWQVLVAIVVCLLANQFVFPHYIRLRIRKNA